MLGSWMLDQVHCVDALSLLKGLPDNSVNCCVTSPPYFGLRDYGTEGQLGLEETPEQYVAALVEVFREVRRVLRHDGVLFLNLGDSYAGAGYSNHAGTNGAQRTEGGKQKHSYGTGLKNKDLIGIPWMVAFALRADGWYLRSEVIWHKPNCMPESVTDRCTKAHETVFLLTKCADYFYDAEAIKEPYTEPMNRWGGVKLKATGISAWDKGTGQETYRDRDMRPDPNGRNKRSVWTIPTQPFDKAHFAVMPEKLVEPCILAGCPETVCAVCGAPYERQVEQTGTPSQARPQGRRALELFEQAGLTDVHLAAIRSVGMADTGKALVTMSGAGKNTADVQRLAAEAKAALGGYYREFAFGTRTTLGFAPTCTCNAGTAHGIVIDPFGGAATVGVVAKRLNRRYLLSEINAAYVELARDRLAGVTPMLAGFAQTALE